jgi:hypothetical protein
MRLYTYEIFMTNIDPSISTPSTESAELASTFQSIFFSGDTAMPVRVPDYQRAFSWEKKQIDLFIRDLDQYQGGDKGYYFGHFIVEEVSEHWDVVDGQQRITTFVLFLRVCRALSGPEAHAVFSMIDRFSTVSYDAAALEAIDQNLVAFLQTIEPSDKPKTPSDKQIIEGLKLSGAFTRSQRRMVLALLRFHHAFQAGTLQRERIGDYIAAIMTAHCSQHLTKDKSVAVNIFEMHNTRGVPLTTLEIIKAMLMKFVYDHRDAADRDVKVTSIQDDFGEIYGMEERLAERSFRGKMTMDQLLALHLRVVDDGTKKTAKEFGAPSATAGADALVNYVESQLRFVDGDKKKAEKPTGEGVAYALNLAHEFKKSVRVVSEILPTWDQEDKLVGDVLILGHKLSCQFFLLICRRLETTEGACDGRINPDSLKLWEKLLFTRDFHGEYYRLKGDRDNFPHLFETCGSDEESIRKKIRHYLKNGFRHPHTNGLQSIVAKHLTDHRESVLDNAFYWWKSKMTYAIYKYEISKDAQIRNVMKGTISVEHVLPQEWQWQWIVDENNVPAKLSDAEKEKWLKDVGSFINGIGNLLLLTPGENSSKGNSHPADKEFNCDGGSYKEHNLNREKWRDPEQWRHLIRARGEEVFDFMLSELIEQPDLPLESPTKESHN